MCVYVRACVCMHIYIYMSLYSSWLDSDCLRIERINTAVTAAGSSIRLCSAPAVHGYSSGLRVRVNPKP